MLVKQLKSQIFDREKSKELQKAHQIAGGTKKIGREKTDKTAKISLEIEKVDRENFEKMAKKGFHVHFFFSRGR